MALVVGINHIRDGVENQTVLGADMGIVGVVGTADDADETAFGVQRWRRLAMFLAVALWRYR